MTNQAFLDEFLLKYDKIASLSSPGYEPREISIIASEAQELLCVTDYNPNSNSLKEGFEETEKRIQDLGELVEDAKLVPLAPSVDNMLNGRFVQLPNSLLDNNPTDYSNVYWFTVFEEIICNEIDPCTGTNRILKIREVNHNEFSFLKSDPFNKPDFEYGWRMRLSKRRQELILPTGLTLFKYHVRYMRKPKPIDLTGLATDSVSELSDHKHRELLNKTIELYLRDTQNIDRMKTQIKQEE